MKKGQKKKKKKGNGPRIFKEYKCWKYILKNQKAKNRILAVFEENVEII